MSGADPQLIATNGNSVHDRLGCGLGYDHGSLGRFDAGFVDLEEQFNEVTRLAVELGPAELQSDVLKACP